MLGWCAVARRASNSGGVRPRPACCPRVCPVPCTRSPCCSLPLFVCVSRSPRVVCVCCSAARARVSLAVPPPVAVPLFPCPTVPPPRPLCFPLSARSVRCVMPRLCLASSPSLRPAHSGQGGGAHDTSCRDATGGKTIGSSEHSTTTHAHSGTKQVTRPIVPRSLECRRCMPPCVFAHRVLAAPPCCLLARCVLCVLLRVSSCCRVLLCACLLSLPPLPWRPHCVAPGTLTRGSGGLSAGGMRLGVCCANAQTHHVTACTRALLAACVCPQRPRRRPPAV